MDSLDAIRRFRIAPGVGLAILACCVTQSALGDSSVGFGGFLPPVLDPPGVNRVEAGSTVPIRFAFTGGEGTADVIEGTPTARPIACDAIEPTQRAGDSSRSDSVRSSSTSDSHAYLWSTDRSWEGTCQVLTLTLMDGSVHRAYFRFPSRPRPLLGRVDEDIVVLEQGDGSRNIPEALIRIDPVSGTQEILSSGDLGGRGTPSGAAYEVWSETFFVVGRDAGLRQVDRATGSATLLTRLPVTGSATGVAIEANGDLLVTDYGGWDIWNGAGRLLRVDRDSLAVSVLAAGSYIQAIRPYAVEVDPSGSVYVAGFSAQGNGFGSSFIRVDPVTGEQTLVASITGGAFYDFALSGDTAYIALSAAGPPSSADRVESLDLLTGAHSPLFMGLLQRVIDVDVDSEGRLLILDQCRPHDRCAGSPVVYRSNASGTLDLLSQDGFMFVPGRLVLLPARSRRDR